MKWLKDVFYGGTPAALTAAQAAAFDDWRRQPHDDAGALRPGGRVVVIAVDAAAGQTRLAAVAVSAGGIAASDSFAVALPGAVATMAGEPAGEPLAAAFAADALLGFLAWAGHAPLFAFAAAETEAAFACAARGTYGCDIDLAWFDLDRLLADLFAPADVEAPADIDGLEYWSAKFGIDRSDTAGAGGCDDLVLAAHAGACLLLMAQARAAALGRGIADVARRAGRGR